MLWQMSPDGLCSFCSLMCIAEKYHKVCLDYMLNIGFFNIFENRFNSPIIFQVKTNTNFIIK